VAFFDYLGILRSLKEEGFFSLAFQQFNYIPRKPRIEYITREQDENKNNTSKIGQTTHSNKITRIIPKTISF